MTSLAEAAVRGINPPEAPDLCQVSPCIQDWQVASFEQMEKLTYDSLIAQHMRYPNYQVVGYATFPLVVPAWVVQTCLEAGGIVLDDYNLATNTYTYRWVGVPT